MQVTFEVDDRKLEARLANMPAALQKALVAKLTVLTTKLENHIKADKLSGQVLNVRTGALRRSIFAPPIQVSPNQVVGTVESSSDVKYARIHEFGGTIDVPEITPVKAQALHFVMNGKDVFAKRVRAHTVHMPERSFMRSALADMRSEIEQGIRQAVEEGTQ
jgi:phage gpG-like protein